MVDQRHLQLQESHQAALIEAPPGSPLLAGWIDRDSNLWTVLCFC